MKNKTLMIVILGAAILFGGYNLFSSTDSTTDTGSSLTVIERSNMAITDVSAGNAVLIDVRTPAEFEQLHATPAQLFELTALQQGLLPELDKDQKIYVYCRSGNRSAMAIKILQDAGFTDVIDIETLINWQNAGGATSTGI